MLVVERRQTINSLRHVTALTSPSINESFMIPHGMAVPIINPEDLTDALAGVSHVIRSSTR
jgi:hypothetical protein